jgi:hypothetical protein
MPEMHSWLRVSLLGICKACHGISSAIVDLHSPYCSLYKSCTRENDIGHIANTFTYSIGSRVQSRAPERISALEPH